MTLGTITYVIRQTQNVNILAEQYKCNIVGKKIRLQLNGPSNRNPDIIRAYILKSNGQPDWGPVLGLDWSDLDDA